MTGYVQQSFAFGAPAEQRRRQNAVIEAGAGTGKTTRIVKEVVLRLIEEPDLKPERIVLVTFTEKAAAEIADRVRWALTELFLQNEAETLRWPRNAAVPILEFRGTDRAAVLRAAETQLTRIDRLRSQTIHSFCQSILKLHALDAGIDPRFRIVQGFEQSQLINETFDRWLASETANPQSERITQWQQALARIGKLSQLRDVIFALVAKREIVDDARYTLGSVDDVHEQLAAAVRNLAAVPDDACKSEEASLLVDYLRQTSAPDDADLEAWIAYFEPAAAVLRGCDVTHIKGAKSDLRLLRGEKRDRTIYDQLVQHQAALATRALASRFAAALDEEKRTRGVVDFDDLLILTDKLLEDSEVLRAVRNRYDYIFVDEFQDTDRVQARIIDRLARDDDGRFVPGRTVLVGDPKQSIYSFRRADPEMFMRTIDAFVYGGADREYLEQQYRSDAALVRSINAMFGRLFADRPGASPYVALPTYRPLDAGRSEQYRVGEARIRFIAADVPENEDRDWAEAEIAADFIARHAHGDYRQFAILMRKMNASAIYADVFARRGIPLIIPPGRAFLEQPAVIDLLAVLRSVAYPFDRGSLVSAARGPYFALGDDEIARHYVIERPEESSPSRFDHFLAEIARYAEMAPQMRVAELIDLIVDERQIEMTFAMLKGGERDLAQLRRFRDVASEYDLTTGGSLRQFLAEVMRRQSFSDEAEPVWADEAANAVRLMTVHASKGLEFHTVLMPDLGSGTRGDEVEIIVIDDPPRLAFTGALQSLSAEHQRFAGDTLREIDKERDAAEINRLFYVGVTRAKSDVVFITTTEKKKNESFWKPLTAIFEFDLKTIDAIFPAEVGETVERYTLGSDVVDVVFERAATPQRDSEALARFVDPVVARLLDAEPLDEERREAPRRLDRTAAIRRRAADRKRNSGIVVHRALELWDGGRSSIPEVVERSRREFGLDRSEAATLRVRLETLAGSAVIARIRNSDWLEREMPILFTDADGLSREGRIDLLVAEGERLTVVDYKTGEPYEERRAKDETQVRQYCIALEQMSGRRVEGLLWYLDADQVVNVTTKA